MTVSTKKIIPGGSLLYAAAIMTFVFINVVIAATYLKANNQTNLNTSGSWTIAGYPGSGDIGQWDNTVMAANGTVSLGGDMTWAGMIIANPGGWVTFNAGNTLTLGSSGIDMSNATQSLTINCNVALNANQTWTVAATPIFYMDGVVSGTGSLTKSGAGTLSILNNTNTYSGGTTVNAGYLLDGNAMEENTAAFGTGTVTVNSGAFVRFTPGSSTNTYNIANSFALNGGTIIGEDGIQRLATGNGATFTIGASGGTVEATWWGKDMYIDGLVSGSTNLAIAHGPTASNSSAIVHITNPANIFSGTVTVTPQASGVDMYLDLDNITALQSATVRLAAGTGGTSYLQLGTTNATTIIAGLTGAATVCKVQPFTTAGTCTLNVNNAVNDTFGGILQNNTGGVLALTKTGAGTLTLSGNNTYSGLTTVNAGRLSLTGTPTSNALKYVINSGGTISVADRLNLSPIPTNFTPDWMTINGGIFSTAISSGNGYSGNRGFTLGASGGTIEIPNTYNSNIVPISSVIAGAGALTKTGVGTLNLQGANTYSGNTTISVGTLQLGAANVIPNGAGKGNAIVSSTLDLNSYSDTINGLSGAGTIDNSAAGTPILTIGNNNVSSTFSGVIKNTAGSMAIAKIGTGTLTLSGANTYNGMTTINAGTLQLGAANVIPNGAGKGNLTVSGVLDLNTFSDTINGLSGAGTVDNSAAGMPILTIGNNNVSSTFSGVIKNTAGSMAFAKIGTGTLTLSGANTYNGMTTISAGTLQLGAANVIPNGAGKGDVTVTGTLDLNAFSDTVNGLNGAGTVDNSAAGTPTLTIGNNNVASTFSGVIKNTAGSLAITKIGTGTLTLSGANTYSGPTTLSAGTLLITNTCAGPGTITCNGGTLGGTGTVAGVVKVNSGATISPGVGGIATFTINNNLTLSSGSTYLVDIGSSTCDKINVFGVDTLNNPTLQLNLTNAPLAGQTFDILDQSGSAAIIGTFNGIAEGGTITGMFNTTPYIFVVSYRGGTNNNDVVLTLASGPSITTQPTPTSQAVYANSPASFSIVATGTLPLTYSWTQYLKSGTTTSVGTNSPALSFTQVPATYDSSTYKCQVTNVLGSALSNACMLYVITSIGNFSYSQGYLSGLVNTAFVPDTPKITGYVTKYSISPSLPNGLKLDTTTGIISGTPTVQLDSAGFIVAASNGSGGNSTAPISIKVFAPAKVATSPVSQTAAINGTVKFFVVASGSKPYTYTWMSQTSPPVAIGVNSDTLTLPNIDTTFNNTRYKCIVQNTFQSNSYFDTSKACTLHVILPPKITQQPASQTVEKGSQVVFSVKAASGTLPFSYVWIRNGTDTLGDTLNSSSITNSLTLASVAGSKDKSTYQCFVTNPSGTAASALCTLHVVRAAFSGSPQTGTDSLTVSFIDSSTGGVSKWKWDFGDNTKDSVQNPTHKYTTPGAYSVKLNAFAGTVMDSVVQPNFISISYSKPKPAFSGTPLTARDSITVNFTDLSIGVVTGWQWTYGDSTPPDTTKNPSHTYKQPGSYSVKLKITGPGGVDSTTKSAYVYVYSKLDNPTRISGRRLSTTKVELTLSNYDSIPTSKTTTIAPWSDSLGLYFKKDSLPSSPSTSTLLQTINTTALQGAVKPFKDTVTVPLSAPADSVFYGFGTALNWNDGTKSVMQGGNGTLVLMKDTVPPINNLVISGKYLGVDTAAVFLDNISLIDTGKVDSVAVWYGLRDSVNFSDSYTKWFPVSALISGAIANRYTYKIRDPRFNTDTTHAYVAVEEMGKNLMTSAEKDTSFMVGRIRPQNPIKLKAKAISSSAIQLTWNRISGYDRIRIWKGLKAVPPGPDSIPTAQYDTLIPAVTDTAILATGLMEKHWYYFGAQVLQNALWSKVTDSASAKDSTPASLDTSTLVNTIKILKCTFDITRNAPFVVWHVDTLDTAIKVGIEYSLNNYPLNPATAPSQIITVKSKTDSAAVKLGGTLALNATYYVTMWMYRNGKWSVPTDSSEAKAISPSYTSWQTVTYFNAPHDTVLAFGGRVRLINENVLDITPTIDTLRVYTAPAATLNGFVPVSIGFTFAVGLASYPMHVGLKVDSSLVPKGYTLQNVRIYRQDSTGAFSVMYNTDIDTADWIVSVLTKDLDDPFIAMVDTMAPTVRVLSTTKNPETAGSVVYDTLEITDNIVNDSWVYRFARGGSAYLPGDTLSGTTRKTKDTVYVKIPALDVTNSAGVRAIFVANDAVHFVTRDLSRQVIRDSAANTISTAAMKWTPLWVTTTLDTSPANIVLEDLGTKSGWAYDIMKFRLFRWLSYDGNTNSPDNKWVEYADSISWMFNFIPGDLFWIKTKTPTVLHLGSGVTTPLTQPSNIVLAPGALSDVALPFDFSIRIGDIIDSTNSDSEKVKGKGDSLQYNIFVQDSTGRWRLEPLYYSDWGATAPEHMNKADSVSGGFCVYNPFSVAVTLSIPAIPTSLSKQTPGSAKRKTQTAEGWSVRVKGRTAEGSLLSTVYCGQSEGKITQKKFYPAMPLIEGAGIRVCDDKLHQWGHEMAQGLCAKDGGVTYLLAFNAQSGTTGEITYQVENIEALPKGLKAVIMVPGSELLADPSAQQSISVSAASGSSFRKLVIGNASYIAKAQKANAFFRLALVGVSPNPFGRMLRIRYSLPYDGIGRVEFSMIDLRGRQLWATQGAIGPGLQEFLWNGASAGKRPVSSGMYLLRMKALDTKGKTAGVFTARITYLP